METVVETPVVDNPTPTVSWKENVPKELRYNDGGVDALAKFEDDPALAAPIISKSFLELHKTMGNRVKLPGEDAEPEELSAFYQKCGRPEKPDGYTLPQLEEGQVLDENIINPIMVTAHEAGINDKAFGKLVEKYLHIEGQIKEQQEQAITQETNAVEDQLKKDWAGDYDKNIETIERVFREFSTEDTRDVIKNAFNEAGLGRNPIILNWLKDIGKGMLNDTFVQGKPPKSLDKDYKPYYPNSPEMYATMEGEEGEKARAWFIQNKGHEF
jgi:hypothetical protein